MTAQRAPFARQFASCTVLLIVAALAAACGGFGRELEPGTYRAVLELPGGELPFGLDIAQEETGFVLYLVNGDERARVTDVTVGEGRLAATLPGGQSTLRAEIRGRKLQGEVSLPGADGERQALPFRATAGQTWRFFEEPSTDNADVSGRWSVRFTSDAGEPSPGVVEFTQSFERVTGTIQSSNGGHRFLAGEVHGDELYLSRFDGVSADLCKARVDDAGDLAGECWSVATGHQQLRAERNPDAVLEAGNVPTASADPTATTAPSSGGFDLP